jgi:hypothetical protein
MVDRRNEEDYLCMNDNLAMMNASMKKPTPPQARIVVTQTSKDSIGRRRIPMEVMMTRTASPI